MFDRFDIDTMLDTLRQRGAPYGIQFGELERLCNTRLALESAEFARDAGKYEPFHDAVFKAYFTLGHDIGKRETLLDIADSTGLDTTELNAALDDKRYARRVDQGSEKAKRRGVTAIPAFSIEGMDIITGAVSEDVFRKVLQELTDKC